MNAITYFKLNSPYEGDVTKNCALTGSEVDNNFYTLEGRDVKSVELIDDKIVVTLMNGDKLTTDNVTEDCVKGLTIDFDEVNGILTITQNGITQTITGFATKYSVASTISVDGTLVGNGLSNSPVGISPVTKTGQYRPVNRIIDMTEGEKLPQVPSVCPGDRFLSIENVNNYGYLYNYEGLKKIACKLTETGSQWRVPTKQDWDDMLNAIEPCDEFKNHSDGRSNKFLGKFAGKLLKSKNYWRENDDVCDNCDCGEEHTCIDYNQEPNIVEDCNCESNNTCHPNYCGEWGHCHHRHEIDTKGIDKYGFNAVPAGYATEAKDYLYFNERAYFWTASNHEYRDAYIKALTYNKNSVLQDILASDNYLSVRLVKDFDGSNHNEIEDILGGTYSTVLMPSVTNGRAIWTSVNIALAECACDNCCTYVLPNNGQEMEYIKKYYINEWTGREWLKKEVADGESVVVINEIVSQGETTDVNEEEQIIYNKIYTEYRVVDGELVDVAKLIYDKIIEFVQEHLGELEIKVDDLTERLNGEIERSTQKDTELEESVQAEAQTREARDTELEGRIETEEQVRAEKDTELEGMMLTQEGTEFNKDTGILTLKSKDGTNNIDVQFNFNFGTF